MRQRVMIAMALSCDPSVLIADEPTTALDVTIQAQILREMSDLRERTGTAIILVTHDLGVVADIADRIAVMYAGRIVETGTLDEIFYDPQHPYTWGLLGLDHAHRPAAARAPAVDPRRSRRRSSTGPRAATSARAAGTSSASARRRPALEGRIPEAPGHDDRCWLALDEKRKRASSPTARSASRSRARSRERRPPERQTAPCSTSSTSSSTSRSARACSTASPGHVHAVDDVTFAPARGRDARPRRRVGLRQDDAVAHADAPARADRRDDRASAAATSRTPAAARCARCAARCRWSSRTRSRR